jgi:hypothetical protein
MEEIAVIIAVFYYKITTGVQFDVKQLDERI